MSTDQPEQATTEPKELELPEAVAETLYELATRESLELSMTYCIGECKLPDGELPVSTSIDTAFGSIGFVDDRRGVRWVTWQDYVDSRAGARRLGPTENANKLAQFCFGILLEPHRGASRERVRH